MYDRLHGGNVTGDQQRRRLPMGRALIRSLGVTGRFAERIRWLALVQRMTACSQRAALDAVPFPIYAATLDAA